MTPAYQAPPREPLRYGFSVPRVLVMGGLLFLLVTGCLHLFHTAFAEYGRYLEAEDKKTSLWLVEQLSYLLPLVVVAAFQSLVYAKRDRRDGVLQRERAYELLLLGALLALVLLPLVWIYSDRQLILSLMAGIKVDKNEGQEYETLLLQVLPWLLRFVIPLLLLFVYHMARARAEETEISALETSQEATGQKAPEVSEAEAVREAVAETDGDEVGVPAEAPVPIETDPADKREDPTEEAAHDANTPSV